MIRRTVELRRDDDDSFSGTIIRYDDEARVQGRSERFAPGSVLFDDVILNLMHDRGQPVARTGTEFLAILDSPTELRLRGKYPPTDYGRRARELVTAGVLRGLSAEFVAERERIGEGNHARLITRARLYGVGLVDRPAYPMSVIDRSLELPLEYRQSGLTATLEYGKPFVVSLARKLKVLIPAPLDLADDIYLLDGYDYNRALASTGAGSLQVTQDRGGLVFRAATRLLRRSPQWPETRGRLRAGLLNGVTPGIQRGQTRRYTDADGFTVEVIESGGVCEVNLTSRRGAGFISGGGRRRWLF